MRIATWNIRGLGANEKKRTVQKLIKEEYLDVLGLVETKHMDISVWTMKKLWGNQAVDWVHSPAENGSGGLVASWNKEIFVAAGSLLTRRWICVLGTFKQDSFSCALCVVYAPNTQRDRLQLWNDLRQLKQQLGLPLIMMGDFNEVVKLEERRNSTRMTVGMREFDEFIQDMQLLDLDINQRFTWMRENAASRLDRIMVSKEVFEHYQNLSAYCRDRLLSDHFPVIMNTSKISWGPCPFRSLDTWLEEPKFMELFRKEWLQLHQIPLEQKLKAMKKPLRKWNKEVFGIIDIKLKTLQEELSKLDRKEQFQQPQEADVHRRRAIQSQLWLWMARRERYWKQMSRSKVLKEGDRNTKYFHLMATMRRKRKMIDAIVVDGIEYVDPRKVRKAIVDYFKGQYSRRPAGSFDIGNLGLATLTENQRQHLSAVVSKEEIKEALLSCDPSRAPGYDGFNIKCIKHIWPIVGDDFSRSIESFFQTAKLPTSLNMTWVTLIPKKAAAVDILDYRPISMVGSVYKIIAKILSRRLKHVVADLIGETQTAFVNGRQVLDGALIANETVNWLQKTKKEGVLLKLDFQKAYDTVNLESLDLVLKEMGFDIKWRQWIKVCTTTASISILVNGTPSKPFKMQRGLRQGDPISPYLFVMMTEVLNLLLSKAAQIGLFQGIKVGSRAVSLSHLQFADDTLIFSEPRMDYLQNIKNILYSFQCFSGLKVNYAKSGLVVIGKDERWAAEAADILECKLVQLPITYLGVPLGANMRKAASWQPVITKIKQRLATWRANCLSRAGKLVLIKAVLNSLPIYFLSLFKMPRKVANEIIRIQKRFLWNANEGKRYSALVKWDVVQRPKKQGGLGVTDPMLKNAALLFKWWWRFACEEGALWRRVIQSLHEEDHIMLPKKIVATIPGPWRGIKQIAWTDTPISKAFLENISVKVGNGSRVKFWSDVWANRKTLKELFPTLFAISSQQNEIISNMGWFEGELWRWTLSWKRELSEEEQEHMISLQTILQQQCPVRNETDQLQWCGKSDFATKSLIVAAHRVNLGNVVVDHLAPTVWMNLAPPKVELMVWLGLLGRLNTKDMLVRKRIIPQECNRCSFCSQQAETSDHLLVTCQVTWRVWCTIAESLGLRQLQQQQEFRQMYEWWLCKSRSIHNKWRKKLILLAFFAVAWSLWNKRNLMVFQNHELEHNSFCHTVRWRIVIWSKEWKEKLPYSTEEIIRHFNDIPVLFP